LEDMHLKLRKLTAGEALKVDDMYRMLGRHCRRSHAGHGRGEGCGQPSGVTWHGPMITGIAFLVTAGVM
jgi:hypothetical protein